jgi:LysM domain-containing protein
VQTINTILIQRGRVAVLLAAAAGLALVGCDSDSADSEEAAASTAKAGESTDPTGMYIIDAGDTLSGIAASYGVTLDELVDANGWTDGADHAIFPGDAVQLPDGAVAVSTTRPAASNGNTTTTTRATGGSATSSTAATSGDYSQTGQMYAGPRLGGSTDAPTNPLGDGVYWVHDAPTLSADRSSIVFTIVSQMFFGDACREHFGTTPDACLSDYGGELGETATASMSVGSGSVSVLYLHGGLDVEAYRITSQELARLLAGQSPADDAPDDFEYDRVDSYVVTVRDGSVTSADQIWTS